MKNIYITDSMLNEISKFRNIPQEDLLQKTICEILQMNDDMKTEKARNEAARNAADNEFIRLVKKYFRPYEILNKYWSEQEIIVACSKHLTASNLTDEHKIPVKRCGWINPSEHKPFGEKSEYIRTSVESVPRYAKNPAGEQLLYGERVNCHVYRVASQYQGLRHGDVILELLYGTYPELEEFKFSAYEYREYDNSSYEIYPNNHMYVPLDALLSQDIQAIIDRNIAYGKSYNHGEYTVEKVKERIASAEIQHFFDVIRNMKSLNEKR